MTTIVNPISIQKNTKIDRIEPGFFLLKRFSITSYDGTQTADISNIVYSFTFSESLSRSNIAGEAFILDAINVIDKFPIRGEETILITYEDLFGFERTEKFFLYSVIEYKPNEQSTQATYKISFVSYQHFLVSKRIINKSYSGIISDMVTNLFDEYYEDNYKKIIVEPTQDTHTYAIPRFTPEETMQFLASRAYSTTNSSCTFHFFETRESYYFCSYEFLIEQGKEQIKTFSYNPFPDYTGQGNANRMFSIINLRNDSRFHTTSQIYNGAYKNNVIEIDIKDRRQIINDFDYIDNYNSYKYTDNKTRLLHTNSFITDTFTKENQPILLTIKDYNNPGERDGIGVRERGYYPEILSNRMTYQYHLNSMKLDVSIYGRCNIKAGDIINLEISEFQTDSQKKNEWISGNYIVMSIKHNFAEDSYVQNLNIAKMQFRG